MVIEYVNFEGSALGQALKNLIDGPERLVEFKAFSREGYPALTALVSEATQLLKKFEVTETRDRNYVKQNIGDYVARIMRDAGYVKANQRSVPGKLFSSGACWVPRDDVGRKS